MKNSNDTTGNRTRDLPACSAEVYKESYFLRALPKSKELMVSLLILSHTDTFLIKLYISVNLNSQDSKLLNQSVRKH